MRTKTVIFGYVPPPYIHDFGTVGFGTDTVFPLIGIGKTAPRPAQIGDFHLFQRIDHVHTHAVFVRNFGIIFSYVKPTVDASAEVLGKMPVNVPVDGMFPQITAEGYFVLGKDRV